MDTTIRTRDKYSNNILEAKVTLELLYESTFGSVDINYTKIIFLIKNKVDQLSIRNSDYFRQNELIDLSIATKILLNDFIGLDYFIETQIQKCLQNFNDEINKHNQLINSIVIQDCTNNNVVDNSNQQGYMNNRQYMSIY